MYALAIISLLLPTLVPEVGLSTGLELSNEARLAGHPSWTTGACCYPQPFSVGSGHSTLALTLTRDCFTDGPISLALKAFC